LYTTLAEFFIFSKVNVSVPSGLVIINLASFQIPSNDWYVIYTGANANAIQDAAFYNVPTTPLAVLYFSSTID
jgi:hypothetical protein